MGGSEEIDEQSLDALGLVVMHPMRGVRQPLDPNEVRHVVVIGLGQAAVPELWEAVQQDDQWPVTGPSAQGMPSDLGSSRARQSAREDPWGERAPKREGWWVQAFPPRKRRNRRRRWRPMSMPSVTQREASS